MTWKPCIDAEWKRPMPQNENFLALSTIWLYQVRRAWADTACIDRLSIIGLVLAIVAIEGDYVSIEIQ
ncbi:hypothetical protein, partial [Xanthomonas hortorum]|uniref:hypothetical protein n=1 Tax=Xanthomonas hortorum TaxID=56454 RepID=UPI00178C3CEC